MAPITLAPLALILPLLPAAAEPPHTPAGDTPRVYRVVGDPAELSVERDGDTYRSGRSFTEAALPDGYPAPTAPGAVEIKTYPAVRRAQVSGESGMNLRGGQGFWLLFNHIKERDIAMTAPVEMIYAGDGMPEPLGDPLPTHTNGEGEAWTMSFLYRSSDLGPTGTDGAVEILDAEPVKVLALGVRGRLDERGTREGVERLVAWIEASGRYEIAGHARTMGYNGPYVPRDVQWWEIQIPIREVERGDADPGTDSANAED